VVFSELKSKIDDLRYNFSEYNLDDFIRHIESSKGITIHLILFPMANGTQGFWTRRQVNHYIAYSSVLHPVHKKHTILHELAHVVLDHQPRPLGDLIPRDLLQEFGIETEEGLFRAAYSKYDQQDDEAEEFVFDIQQRLFEAKQLRALTENITSLPGYRPYADAMAFGES
jgi:hypothetical protein